MRLALRMGRTLSELRSSMSAEEVNLWMAFQELEGPLGDERGDLQAGTVAAQVANAFASKKDRPASPLDYLPEWDKQEGKRRRKQRSRQRWLEYAQELKKRQSGEDDGS